ncbi:hypothetical protein [Streptomyces sp. SID1034]|uniref:hypothetical protein n=1 Tax=Streptomyces sp. SID1034 TaxID=2690248 RepID=UPI001371A2DA|nr:hypothetical protein [Streptomyces sp. SID1034]MYV93727.1 hypothetical protein [Streptomyces sp. SID1034]
MPDQAACKSRRGVEHGERGAAAAAVLARHLPDGYAHPALREALLGVGFIDAADPQIARVLAEVPAEQLLHLGRSWAYEAYEPELVHAGLELLRGRATLRDRRNVQMLGLLSRLFGRGAFEVLASLDGQLPAILWLADRSDSWGRLHAVHLLRQVEDPRARSWMLRQAVNGDYLNQYFAGDLADDLAIHEVLGASSLDDGLVDHLGRMLRMMTDCHGMGVLLADYPFAGAALNAYARHAAALEPSIDRYITLHVLQKWSLAQSSPAAAVLTALMQRPAWLDGVRQRLLDPEEPWHPGGPRVAERLSLDVDRLDA